MNFSLTHYILVGWLCLFCTLDTQAQSSSLRLGNQHSLKDRFTGIRAGLFADNGVHPGLKLGSSYLLGEKARNKKYLFNPSRRKNEIHMMLIQYLADGHVGFYNHPNNHTGVFVGVGFTRMKTHVTKLRTFGLSFEANYLRRIYNIPTLELDGNGGILEIGGAGTNSVQFTLAPSFGKLFRVGPGQRYLHLYLKPHLQWLQYDFRFFPNASLEIGAQMNLVPKA